MRHLSANAFLAMSVSTLSPCALYAHRLQLNICQDEEQAQFSIYKTEIGDFAIGNALTDYQLFSLCQDRGDNKGSLKFLISHTSAVVHEEPHGPYSASDSAPSWSFRTLGSPSQPHAKRPRPDDPHTRRPRMVCPPFPVPVIYPYPFFSPLPCLSQTRTPPPPPMLLQALPLTNQTLTNF